MAVVEREGGRRGPVEWAQDTRTFLQECVIEMQKVTWPDYEQLKNATLVVIVFVIVLSGIIWLMDLTVRGIINVIMGIFGA